MCSAACDAERACERLTASFRSDWREDDRFAADPVEKGFTLAPGQVSACPAVSCSKGRKPDGGFTGCVAEVWKAFCRALGVSVGLSSGYQPQTNGQAERANQDLGTTLRCVAARNPPAWSDHLSWIECAHNFMSCAATGMSPFECSLGYQPPLFPSQEDDISVPSVQHHLRRCRRVWKGARTALLHSAEHNRLLPGGSTGVVVL